MYYGYYGFTPGLMILFILSVVLSMVASGKVNSNYNKYSRVYSKTGINGAQAARKILDANGLYHVQIQMTYGKLSDHYDPRTQIIRLSQDVYNSNSIASIAVAAHECGHAIQHARQYTFLKIRSAMAAPVNIANSLSWILIMAGLLMGGIASSTQSYMLMDIGILMFALVVLFHLVTLPVELNASKRALVQMEELGLVFNDEKAGAKKMLSAAALTYVAALAAAVVQLLRLLAIRGRD